GTALAKCYNLNRFSEDIDLDATKEDIKPYIKKFCQLQTYTFRIAKDTATVKRGFINYGNDSRPLKVEVSYRRKEINPSEYTEKNGIQVYSINRLAQMKALAYSSRDLYDLSFICNNYFVELTEQTILNIKDALAYKGLEQFDYIVNTQNDSLINSDKLLTSFLEMYEKIGLLDDFTINKEKNVENYIENKDFINAYQSIDFTENISSKYRGQQFIKEVVKIHGADLKAIREAADAVTSIEHETTEFSVRLFENAQKTEEYRRAKETAQVETVENTKQDTQ
ncbi:MAG: nucleotidyl transferase AbiEii/AbiGii toxin family protein, partial [Candidatus Gastranaerophilales bacterium]|nr:nucleotidyl transferase AbiEii/AbiGii toxin family protein [Candidatus Gastranaerophilales bacterium]